MTDANTLLMKSIHAKWDPAIVSACKTSTVPPAFLAALIANESGGNPDAKRHERNVLAALWELLQGRAASYGSIRRDDVLAYISAPDPGLTEISPAGLLARLTRSLQQLDSLATSWGLTQIMGYEAIPFASRTFWTDSEGSLRITLRMLAQFSERYQLDLAKDFAELLNCWNTGRPHGAPTADPQYIPNGLARMNIYQGFSDDDEPPKAMSA
ncbi:MAG: N-acetylmuramidase family protein [Acidobacteriia bacterium]|nr:N-acetylmuramidase family protein [Terriglobia bacterium]